MNNSVIKTFGVTLAVCLLCSLFVSFAAVSLRDQQNTNKLNDKRIKILEAANIYDDNKSVEALHHQFYRFSFQTIFFSNLDSQLHLQDPESLCVHKTQCQQLY